MILTEDEMATVIDAYLTAHGTATERELDAAVQLAEERTILNTLYTLATTGQIRLTLSDTGQVLSYSAKVSS